MSKLTPFKTLACGALLLACFLCASLASAQTIRYVSSLFSGSADYNTTFELLIDGATTGALTVAAPGDLILVDSSYAEAAGWFEINKDITIRSVNAGSITLTAGDATLPATPGMELGHFGCVMDTAPNITIDGLVGGGPNVAWTNVFVFSRLFGGDFDPGNSGGSVSIDNSTLVGNAHDLNVAASAGGSTINLSTTTLTSGSDFPFDAGAGIGGHATTYNLTNVDIGNANVDGLRIFGSNSVFNFTDVTVNQCGYAGIILPGGADNNTINLTDCSVTNAGQTAGDADGMFFLGANNTVTIDGSTFANNGRHGINSDQPQNLTVTNSTFDGNSNGIAFFQIADDGYPVVPVLSVDGSTFVNQSGDAIWLNSIIEATVTNSTFDNNAWSAVYRFGDNDGNPGRPSTITLTNCTVTNSQNGTGLQGIDSNQLWTVTGCTIAGNAAEQIFTDGFNARASGTYPIWKVSDTVFQDDGDGSHAMVFMQNCDGGVTPAADFNTGTTFLNCVFEGARAFQAYNSSAVIAFSTLATDASPSTGVLTASDWADVQMFNSIVDGFDVALEAKGSTQLVEAASLINGVNNASVQDFFNTAPYNTPSIYGGNPDFVIPPSEPGPSDLRLYSGSDAIDAAYNIGVLATDLDGNARPGPISADKDMGAYEYSQTRLAGTLFVPGDGSNDGPSGGVNFDLLDGATSSALHNAIPGDTIQITDGGTYNGINVQTDNLTIIGPATINTAGVVGGGCVEIGDVTDTLPIVQNLTLSDIRIDGGGAVINGVSTVDGVNLVMTSCTITNVVQYGVIYVYGIGSRIDAAYSATITSSSITAGTDYAISIDGSPAAAVNAVSVLVEDSTLSAPNISIFAPEAAVTVTDSAVAGGINASGVGSVNMTGSTMSHTGTGWAFDLGSGSSTVDLLAGSTLNGASGINAIGDAVINLNGVNLVATSGETFLVQGAGKNLTLNTGGGNLTSQLFGVRLVGATGTTVNVNTGGGNISAATAPATVYATCWLQGSGNLNVDLAGGTISQAGNAYAVYANGAAGDMVITGPGAITSGFASGAVGRDVNGGTTTLDGVTVNGGISTSGSCAFVATNVLLNSTGASAAMNLTNTGGYTVDLDGASTVVGAAQGLRLQGSGTINLNGADVSGPEGLLADGGGTSVTVITVNTGGGSITGTGNRGVRKYGVGGVLTLNMGGGNITNTTAGHNAIWMQSDAQPSTEERTLNINMGGGTITTTSDLPPVKIAGNPYYVVNIDLGGGVIDAGDNAAGYTIDTVGKLTVTGPGTIQDAATVNIFADAAAETTLDGVTVTNAGTHGLYQQIGSTGNLTVNNSVFTGNALQAIELGNNGNPGWDWSGDLNLSTTTITGNGGYGIAGYADGVWNLVNCDITNNSGVGLGTTNNATAPVGPAITITDSRITTNTYGINLTGGNGSLAMVGSTVADSVGQGIQIGAPLSAALSLTDCTISGNGHAGIHLYPAASPAQAVLTDSVIDFNTLCGVYNQASLDLTMTGGSISENGGPAIRSSDNAGLVPVYRFTDVDIIHTAARASGGVWLGRGVLEFLNCGLVTLELDNTDILGGHCDAGDGGALWFPGGTASYDISLVDSKINGTTGANGYGIGNLTADGPSTLTMLRSEVNDNAITGVYLNVAGGVAGHRIDLTDSSIDGNAVHGIQVWNPTTLTATGSSFDNNGDRGFFFGAGGTAYDISLADSTLNGNRFGLSVSGGGVVPVTLDNVTMDGNTSRGLLLELGGPQYLLDWTGGGISNCVETTATEYAMYTAGTNSVINLTNVSVSNNATHGYRIGGVDPTVNLDTATIDGNGRDGIIAELGTQDVTISAVDSSVSNNGGSGLYAWLPGASTLNLDLTNSNFDGNGTMGLWQMTAAAGVEINATGSTFNNNDYGLLTGWWANAGSDSPGTITLTDCQFNGNAPGEGMVVGQYTSDMTLEATGCEFSNNGVGGFAFYPLHETLGTTRQATLTSCTMTGNGRSGVGALRVAGIDPIVEPVIELVHCHIADSGEYGVYNNALWLDLRLTSSTVEHQTGTNRVFGTANLDPSTLTLTVVGSDFLTSNQAVLTQTSGTIVANFDHATFHKPADAKNPNWFLLDTSTSATSFNFDQCDFFSAGGSGPTNLTAIWVRAEPYTGVPSWSGTLDLRDSILTRCNMYSGVDETRMTQDHNLIAGGTGGFLVSPGPDTDGGWSGGDNNVTGSADYRSTSFGDVNYLLLAGSSDAIGLNSGDGSEDYAGAKGYTGYVEPVSPTAARDWFLY